MEINYTVQDFLKSEFNEVRESLIDRPGVYILTSSYNETLYVGMSKNLSSRLGAHVSGNSNVDTTDLHHVRVLLTSTATEADMLETYMINELKPTFNISKAQYPEFIERLEARLPIVEGRIEDAQARIRDICAEIEINAHYDEDLDYGDYERHSLGRELFLVRSLRSVQAQLHDLRREESLLKRRGATNGAAVQKCPSAVRGARQRKALYGDARGWVTRDRSIQGGVANE